MESYTNESNPFADGNLDKVFVWKKKAKKLGWTKEQAKAHALEVRANNLVEIELAKRRRVEREREMMDRQEARDREDRLRESASHSDWEVREEEFMLKQHKQAAALRINQGRETAADAIARNVLLAHQLTHGAEIGPDGKPLAALSQEVGMNPTSPLDIIERHRGDEAKVQEISREIARYLKLENSGSEDVREYWRALQACCEDLLWRSEHVPQAVRDSIREFCEGKTLQQVRAEKADALSRRGEEGGDGLEDAAFYRELERVWWFEEQRKLAQAFHLRLLDQCRAGGRSEHRVVMWDQVELQHEKRLRGLEGQEDDDLGDNNIESIFLECCYVGEQDPSAGRTLKPRFWNRVKLGYDWNKYNRAHYDSDNKPPKIVFGYKFNIMYPGLKKTPTYRLEPWRGEGGDAYCVLKFIASAPFVDLGFKIENKDWERGAHSGFKNTFENGVLQLHFNFVRRRYRR